MNEQRGLNPLCHYLDFLSFFAVVFAVAFFVSFFDVPHFAIIPPPMMYLMNPS